MSFIKVTKVTPSEIFLLKEIDNLNALLNESIKMNNSNNFKFYKLFNQNSSPIINYIEVNYLKDSSEITYLKNLNVNIEEILNMIIIKNWIKILKIITAKIERR